MCDAWCDARCDARPFYKHAFAKPRAHLPCGPPMWAAQDSSLLPTIHRLVHRLFVRLVPFANAPPMYPSSSVLSFLLLSLRSILLPPSYPAFVAFPLCFPSPPYLPYLPPFHLFPHFIDILLPAAPAALPAPAVPLAHYLHGLHSCPLARLQDKRKAVAAASPEYDHSDGPPRAPCVGGQ